MAKIKKPFSEKELQNVLAKAAAESKDLRSAAIALFENMETEHEAADRKLLASKLKSLKVVSPPKRRSIPEVAKPKAKAKPKTATKK